MANEPNTNTKTQDESHDHGVGHIVPIKLLVMIGAALLVLTWITVAATYIDLGDGNIYIALAIAVVKATLVALFFMHLMWDRPFNGILLVGSFAFVALFIAFTLIDSGEYQPDINEYRVVELGGGDSELAQQKLQEMMSE